MVVEPAIKQEKCGRCGRWRLYACKSLPDMTGMAFDGDGTCRDMMLRYGGTMDDVRAVGVSRWGGPVRRPE